MDGWMDGWRGCEAKGRKNKIKKMERGGRLVALKMNCTINIKAN